MLTVAIIAAGAMGAGVGKVLTRNGVKVLTNLDNRSKATRERAVAAGMEHASFKTIGATCQWVLSILPPSDAYALAERFLAESVAEGAEIPTFVDCNAINTVTVHKIAQLFQHTPVKFIDASIIGGPPQNDGYLPTIYASTHDLPLLERFASLSDHGLKISLLRGEGAGIGDASALKMSYAGISKGATALYATMILAAHEASPATADALVSEMHASQPEVLRRLTNSIPPMVDKAYRWVGEMEEISEFVGGGSGEIYQGMAKLYSRIEASRAGDGKDVEVLTDFVTKAKKRF